MLKLYAVSAALRRDRLLDGGGNHDKKVVYYILCTTITIAREDAGAQCQNFISQFHDFFKIKFLAVFLVFNPTVQCGNSLGTASELD